LLFAALAFISHIFRYENLYAKYVDLLDKLKEVKKSLFFSTVIYQESGSSMCRYRNVKHGNLLLPEKNIFPQKMVTIMDMDKVL
jgi:hypothetical protein